MMRNLLIIIITLVINSLTFSQEVVVPVDVQYSFMNKCLDYIKNFDQKSQLKIGIVYQSKNNYSLSIQEQLLKLIQASQQQSVLKSPKLFDLSNEFDLESQISSLDIVYFTPLRAVNIAEISAVCHKAGVLSIMAIPQTKDNGIVMGFDLENNKTKIVIDQKAASQSRIEIKAVLLKYSRLIN